MVFEYLTSVNVLAYNCNSSKTCGICKVFDDCDLKSENSLRFNTDRELATYHRGSTFSLLCSQMNVLAPPYCGANQVESGQPE